MADFDDSASASATVTGGDGLLSLISWVPQLIDSQVDLIADAFSSLISTNPNPNPKPQPDSAVLPRIGPSAATHLLQRVAQGLIGAVYAGMVLTLVMAVAVILGVLVVNNWVEEPVVLKEKLQFDFTELNPHATLVFGQKQSRRKHFHGGIPVGHTFHVSLELLLPDSDYNRDIGVFQVMGEVISTNGKIISRSSHPSMLVYQSHPIRLMHTFLMGFPLLLGLTRETQKLKVPLLRHKEDTVIRTEAVRITLMPRAGTLYLPQLYEAKVVVQSRLPWLKELIHNWKWTFYVWTSLHIYMMLLALILCFFRPLLMFPVLRAPPGSEDLHEAESVERSEEGVRVREQREFTDTLRKWQQYRRRRKAELLSKSSGAFVEDVSLTSASSYTITKDDPGPGLEEEIGDSESVCLDK